MFTQLWAHSEAPCLHASCGHRANIHLVPRSLLAEGQCSLAAPGATNASRQHVPPQLTSQKGTKVPRWGGQTQAAQDRPGRGPQQGEHSPHRQCHSAVPGTVGQAARGKQEGGEGQWSHGKLIYSRGHVRLLLLRPDLHLPAATRTPRREGGGARVGQQHSKEQDSREGNSQLRRNLDASVTNTAAMKSVTREEEGWGSRPGTPGVGQLSAGRGLRIRVLHPQALLAEAQRLPAHAARTLRHPRSSGLASGERTAQHTEAGPHCVRRYSRPPSALPPTQHAFLSGSPAVQLPGPAPSVHTHSPGRAAVGMAVPRGWGFTL